MNDVTKQSLAIDDVDANAADRFLPMVCQELRKLAVAKLWPLKPAETAASQPFLRRPKLGSPA